MSNNLKRNSTKQFNLSSMKRHKYPKALPLIIVLVLFVGNLFSFYAAGKYFNDNSNLQLSKDANKIEEVKKSVSNPWRIFSWSQALFQFFRDGQSS